MGMITDSCVKEDRSDCPCWLEIDLSGCRTFGADVRIKGWSEERSVIGARVYEADYDTIYEAEVPRGVVSYSACTGFDESQQSGTSVLIPAGGQSDRLFAYRTTLYTDCETLRDKVHLHKQYCNVTMKFKDYDADSMGGLVVDVKGHWNGIDLKTLAPTEGEFRFSPACGSDGTWTFRLPRQGDDSLKMDIYLDGSLADTMDLGAQIRETGYDWGAEDLDDIWIGVDWAQSEITIWVQDWSEGYLKEITI